MTELDRDEQLFEEGLELRDQLRYQHQVMKEIFALTNPRSITPLADMQAIRIKAKVAISEIEKLEALD